LEKCGSADLSAGFKDPSGNTTNSPVSLHLLMSTACRLHLCLMGANHHSKQVWRSRLALVSLQRSAGC